MRELATIAALLWAPAAMSQELAPEKPIGVVSEASGTGQWPAVAEHRADLPGLTVYRPAEKPMAKLPVVLWGNGACRDNGLQHAQFLREVASHGYLVLALGKPRAERAVLPPDQHEAPTPPPPAARNTSDETQWTQMREALDFVSKPGNPFADWADTGKVAAMGHSCGGLQTIAMSADPRVTTSVLFNSGVYNRPGVDTRSNVMVSKEALNALHGPIAYFLGGPEDIAYANARDDVERIGHVPVFFGEMPVGHGGTFWADANGGDWGKVGVAWLDWQLKGSDAAKAMFAGPDCGLCRDARWKVIRKGM